MNAIEEFNEKGAIMEMNEIRLFMFLYRINVVLIENASLFLIQIVNETLEGLFTMVRLKLPQHMYIPMSYKLIILYFKNLGLVEHSRSRYLAVVTITPANH